MTEYLALDGGTLAYDVTDGSGPLVLLVHGMGNSREAYRFLAPALVEAGHRVATVDMRGCGESSAAWPSYTQADVAGDLIALLHHLGGPAILVGHSYSGGAATIAAAKAPSLITAVVELAPFTRNQQLSLGALRVSAFRRGMVRLVGAGVFGSVRLWKSYLVNAYPGSKPADFDASLAHVDAMMSQPARMKAFQAMGRGGNKEADTQLAHVKCPVLIVEGTLDPDWASPQAEGEALVAALPNGRLTMIAGAGHYPHVQYPAQVAAAMLAFLDSVRA